MSIGGVPRKTNGQLMADMARLGWTDPVRSLTEYTSAVTGSSLSVPPKRSADCGSDDE